MRTCPDLKPIVFAACLALASTAALAKPQPKQSGKPKPSNDTIDGNLTCQQVARKSRPLSEVAYYYKTVP